jgi:hypothetical protein
MMNPVEFAVTALAITACATSAVAQTSQDSASA